MKVAVASSGAELDAPMDPRFGRCPWFVIVDTDSMEFEAVENPGPQMGSGAGIQAAQLVGDAGADAVVAGNYGPNAAQALQAGGIRMFQGAGMTVRQAAQAAAAGQLQEIADATVDSKTGMGAGPGMGAGMGPGGGMGGGMGGGRGMGQGAGQRTGWGQQRTGWGQYDWGPTPGPMGPMGPMGMGPGMGPMGGPMGGPMPPEVEEQMRQYHLSMLRAQAQMLEQQLEFIRTQIEYLEKLGE